MLTILNVIKAVHIRFFAILLGLGYEKKCGNCRELKGSRYVRWDLKLGFSANKM